MSDLIVLGYRLRLAYPDVVVDLNRATGMHGVREEGDHLVIGAMTTHYEVMHSERVRRHLQTALEPTVVLVEVRVPKLTFPPRRAML